MIYLCCNCCSLVCTSDSVNADISFNETDILEQQTSTWLQPLIRIKPIRSPSLIHFPCNVSALKLIIYSYCIFVPSETVSSSFDGTHGRLKVLCCSKRDETKPPRPPAVSFIHDFSTKHTRLVCKCIFQTL